MLIKEHAVWGKFVCAQGMSSRRVLFGPLPAQGCECISDLLISYTSIKDVLCA